MSWRISLEKKNIKSKVSLNYICIIYIYIYIYHKITTRIFLLVQFKLALKILTS